MFGEGLMSRPELTFGLGNKGIFFILLMIILSQFLG